MTEQRPDAVPRPDAVSSASEVKPRYYYPNRMGRILLLAVEDVVGRSGLHALSNLAGLEHEVTLLPPSTTDKSFSFETISRLLQAIQDMYGPRGARGIALRVGRICLKQGLRDYGPTMGIAELTFQLLPLSIKLEKGIRVFADLFNNFTDQIVRIEETAETFYWHIERCPVCWGRQSDQPCCHLAVGVLQEALLWVSGGKTFEVEEQTCIACGDETCTIAITKKPLD